jgi:hypothetical protein
VILLLFQTTYFNMTKIKAKENFELDKKYPPSESCSCDICVGFCKRPGWWTVEEAKKAIDAGFANRMMLEISDERDFGVLSPAFKGNEGEYALQAFSNRGCTFLISGKCEIYSIGLIPLECRYCHHDRIGEGLKCHLDIEKEWNTAAAKRLIVQWGNLIGFWQKQGLVLVEKK